MLEISPNENMIIVLLKLIMLLIQISDGLFLSLETFLIHETLFHLKAHEPNISWIFTTEHSWWRGADPRHVWVWVKFL